MVRSPDDAAGSKRAGKFQKGVSGNPSGRPKSTPGRAGETDRMMRRAAKEVVGVVVKLAKEGNLSAARLILDRAVPRGRGRSVAFRIPAIKSGADVDAALGGLVAAMAAGEISAEEASAAATVLEAKRKTLETVDWERRIAALEGQRR